MLSGPEVAVALGQDRPVDMAQVRILNDQNLAVWIFIAFTRGRKSQQEDRVCGAGGTPQITVWLYNQFFGNYRQIEYNDMLWSSREPKGRN